jgi:hypothetical protein
MSCKTFYRVRQKNLMVLSTVILAIVWGGVMQPRSVASWFHVTSVAMEQWTAQHHAFIVEAFSRKVIQPLQHNSYFADTLTFLIVAVFPVITP